MTPSTEIQAATLTLNSIFPAMTVVVNVWKQSGTPRISR